MQAFIRTAVLSVALSAGVAGPLQAQALPSAADLVAKHVAAIGGKDAVLAITSLKQSATMEIPMMGLSASMEMYSAAPNKAMSKTTIPGMGEMMQGFDGTVGFDMNPMAGPRLLEGTELTQAKDNADFHGNLLLDAKNYTSMETVGEAEFNGEAAYKVKLVRTSGTTTTNYFSKATGLMIGSEMTVKSQMGDIEATTKISDYKAFGAVKFPTRLQQSAGPQQINITITDVTVGGAPASAFELPAAIKALVK